MIFLMPAGCLKMHKLLICTDLDRTLIPNGPQPESANARRCFSLLVSKPEVVLAYVSGRDQKLVDKAITQYCLPIPDFVIGDVGTSIYHVGEKYDWSRQPEWENKIARDWDGKNYTAVKKELDGISALRTQEHYKQNQFKLSFYVQLNENKEALSVKINHRLVRAGFKARLVWSVDEPAGIGLLDILPVSASKLHAIEELMELQGFDRTNTVFCGDSGNDLEVLGSPIKAVLVANSQPEVKQQAQNFVLENGNSEQLYIAQGQFHGMNGNYCAGILEGVAHYFPQTTDWMGLESKREMS